MTILHELSQDLAVLNGFLKLVTDRHFFEKENLHSTALLVVLKIDYDIVTIDAASKTALHEICDVQASRNNCYGWWKTDCAFLAEKFAKRLRTLDKEIALEVSVTAGNQQSTTTKGGIKMMTDDAMTYSPEIDGKSVKDGDSEIQEMKQQRPSNPYGKQPQSAISAEMSGAEVIDVTQIKVNFNGGGNSRGGSKAGTKMIVSYQFSHKTFREKYAIVQIQSVGHSLYHLGAEFMMNWISPKINEMKKKEIPVPIWMETLKDNPLPQTGNAHKYRRTKSGYTMNRIQFVVRVPNGMGSVDGFVTAVFASLGKIFKTGIGRTYADYLRMHKPGVYGLETGQSGRKRHLSHEQFANSMERQLVEGFSSKTVEYNVPLDKFMTYGHIKQFFSDTCNYDGWHDVPPGLKKGVLDKIKRGDQYPDWDSCRIRGYDEDDDD